MSEKKPGKPARQALIVLGMHRSGTSALGGVLAKLGVHPPKSLMSPTTDNPRGYWESSVLTAFHDQILESAGTYWSDWDRFNEDWIDSSVGADILGQLAPLIQQEYGDAKLFLVKDPRLCRLLPLWLGVLDELQVTSKFIIPVRHPLEVSDSLATRDQITRTRSQLIWLRHILDAEASSRGRVRVFTRYSDLLFDWRSQVQQIASRLSLKWPRWSSAVEAEIETYLSSALRHHAVHDDSTPENSEIGRWVSRTYRAIKVLESDGENADAYRELDEVKQAFDQTSATYAPVLYEVRSALESKIATFDFERAATVQESRELNKRYDLLNQENQQNYELAMTHKTALNDIREQYQNRENAHASLQASCERMQADIAGQIDARVNLEQALAKSDKERTVAFQEFVDINERHDLLKQKNQELEGISHKIESQLMEMTDVAIRLQDEIKNLNVANRLAEESVQERFSEVATLSKQVLDLEDRIKAREISIRDVNEQLRQHTLDLEAGRAENLSLRETVVVCGSRDRAMQLELEIQARLVAEFRLAVEDIHSSRYWRLAGAFRRASGKPRASVEESPKRDDQLIRESNMFDSTWYLKRYPDVGIRGMDPVKHYLRYGAKEGRDPGPAFSTAGYQARYPDVVSAAINPLIHYLRYGRKEGRGFLALERVIANGNKRAKKD